MHVQAMISAHPNVKGSTNPALIQCIEECYSCAQTCVSCADACLAEPSVMELRQCIRLNLDCADICVASGSMASRRTGSDETGLIEVIEVCAKICRVCGDECGRHAVKHAHCRVCADACRRCQEACDDAVRSIRSVH